MEKIYGVCHRYIYGEWRFYVLVFDNQKDADKWVNGEDHGDYRQRELMAERQAVLFVGSEEVRKAEKNTKLYYEEVERLKGQE